MVPQSLGAPYAGAIGLYGYSHGQSVCLSRVPQTQIVKYLHVFFKWLLPNTWIEYQRIGKNSFQFSSADLRLPLLLQRKRLIKDLEISRSNVSLNPKGS